MGGWLAGWMVDERACVSLGALVRWLSAKCMLLADSDPERVRVHRLENVNKRDS